MVLEGVVILTTDKPNKNGRTYTSNMIRGMLKEIVQPIYGYCCPYGREKAWEIDPTHVSHRINNLRLKDNKLIGDVHIMNTPEGQLLSTRW